MRIFELLLIWLTGATLFVRAEETLLTGDYLLSLLEGAKSNLYVEGSLQCASTLRDA